MILTRCNFWRPLRTNLKTFPMVWPFASVAVASLLKAVGHFLHQNRSTLLRIRLELDGEYDQLGGADCKHLDVSLQLMVRLKISYHFQMLTIE